MGKLCVIDGLDGCGKSTQLEQVRARLAAMGVDFREISFPDYAQPSSALVKQYLAGEFGEDASPFAASSFYAVDRYASFRKFWKEDYEAGKLIVAARYTTSNAIYQLARSPRETWDAFLDWMEDYEYKKLGLPRPDAVCFLDMPLAVSQRLMTERYDGDESKKDLHERNVKFLETCREAALYAAKRWNWTVIPCGEGDQPFSIETVTASLMEWLKPFI